MNKYIDNILTGVLTPASWVYGGIMWVRNKFFDNDIFKEKKYSVPIVGIGNLTVGGTGKTPFVEYIVSHLASEYKIAILSRGYKRKTSGFVLATDRSTPEQIGDEPMQIYRKFGQIAKVAVCEDRRKGIEKLLENCPEINLIILDDSFQHRWVKPKVSILLQDYHRPMYEDKLLPLGRLREQYNSIYRADMIVVTKCPEQMDPINYRVIYKNLEPMSFQKIYFSCIQTDPISPVFPENEKYNISLETLTRDDCVILVTGIAYPRSFIRQFRQYPFKVNIVRFPDHHDFSRRDIEMIEDIYEKQKGKRKIILTTEKDAVRLAYNPYFPNYLKPVTYYQPIEIIMKYGLNGEDILSDLKNLINRRDH